MKNATSTIKEKKCKKNPYVDCGIFLYFFIWKLNFERMFSNKNFIQTFWNKNFAEMFLNKKFEISKIEANDCEIKNKVAFYWL